MQRIQTLAAGLLAAGMLASAAAPPVQRPISMEECLKLALEHNLDIRIQRLGPRMARLNLDNAYAPYDPTLATGFNNNYNSSPTGVDAQGRPYPSTVSTSDGFSSSVSGAGPLGLSYSTGLQMNDTLTTRPLAAPFEVSSAFAGVSLTQPLMRNFWIDATRMNIALRRRDLKSSQEDLRQTVIATVSAVQTAYYSLIAARETVTVQRQALDLAENHKRVQVGVLAPLDEKQSESAVAASRADLLGALNSVVSAQNALKSLLSDNYSQWKDVELVPSEKLSKTAHVLNHQDSWGKGLTLRPDLIKARLDLEQRHITVRYTRNQLYPQLDLRGSYGYSGSGVEYADALGGVRSQRDAAYSFGLQFSMPLTSRAARTNYRLARESVEQALLMYKRLEQSILIEIDNAIAQAQTRLQQVEATGAAVVYAEAALDAEQKKLDNGKSTNFQVISLQRDLTLRRYEEIAALVGYNNALVSLAQSEGATLQRNGIRLDFQ
jgi:outer membrane protein TolC